jgi:hypothetical protein
MPVEYFRYTLVGDVDARAKQDSLKPQGSQATAPSVMGKHPNPENGEVAFHAPNKSGQEAYDRCTAMDDESHQIEIDAGRGGKENDRTWLRARAYCRVNLGESLDQIVKDLDAAGLGR